MVFIWSRWRIYGIYGQRYDASSVEIGGTLDVTLTTAGQEALRVAAAFGGTSSTGGTADTIDVASGFLRDTVGNISTEPTATLSNGTVTLADIKAPTLIAFNATPSTGTETVGDTIALTATVHEDMRADTSFNVTLNTGATITLSRDGSNPKVFTGTYTVTDGGTDVSNLAVVSYAAGNAVDRSGHKLALNSDLDDIIAVGSEFKINTSNTYNTADIWRAPVTVLADGSFVVTWEAVESAGSYNSGIFAQIYDASGTASGSEFQISTFEVGGQATYVSSPSSTALPDGGFVVTWSSDAQDGDGRGVRGQRFDASGATVGPEFQVNTGTDNHQGSSSVTALADGGFVVTWESYLTGGYEQIGSALGIFGQRYDAAGEVVGVEFQINTTADQWQEMSNVEALAGGGFVVTWSTLGDDGTNYNIFGQRYDAAGAADGAEFQVNTTANDDQWVSTTAGLTDGGFVVPGLPIIRMAMAMASTGSVMTLLALLPVLNSRSILTLRVVNSLRM